MGVQDMDIDFQREGCKLGALGFVANSCYDSYKTKGISFVVGANVG